jgi:hypothetical protein
MIALDLQKYLIHVPLVPRSRTATELIRLVLAEIATPFANRLIGHCHTTFEQQLFDVAVAEAEAEVQPHGVADDLNRRTMVLRASNWR